MRTRLVGGVLVCAVLTEVALLACSKRSFNDVPAGGDASNDSPFDSASPLGDDVSDDFPGTPLEAGEASGPPCTMPAGTYTVTYTPTGDAGSPDGGGACFATTSTFVYPPPNPDGGSSQCLYTVQGDLPVCSIAFDCTYDDGQYTTHNNGFIQVLNGSFGGQDTKEVFLDADASFAIVTCQYTLDYTKQ